MNKAVFIDKDGTLIKNIPFNVDCNLICLNDYAVEALQSLQNNQYLLIIISNQEGLAKGFFTEEKLIKAFEFIKDELRFFDIKISAYYFCPHHEYGNIEAYSKSCSCRKPLPGMILKAANDFEIDLSKSWMLGDILNDVEAGNRAGCKSILINNNNETEWLMNDVRKPFKIVDNLKQAAELIISKDKY